MRLKRFPFVRQPDTMDCGPACLKMIFRFYGKTMTLSGIRNLVNTHRAGSTLAGISQAAEKLGMEAYGVKLNSEALKQQTQGPCILFWNNNHFVVLYKISRNYFYISDPAIGKLKYRKEDFLRHWTGTSEENAEGVALLMLPTERFFSETPNDVASRPHFAILWNYVRRYRQFFIQLGFGLIIGSFLQLIIPFLTQSVVDIGVMRNDLHFIYLVLIAQLLLFVGRMSVDLIRNWILLHLSTRINITLVSDFFIQLMKLPIAYFDRKMTGDILQRVGDHKRIETLLTSSSLNVLFSFVNLVIFTLILLYYNPLIFLVFIVGSLLYFGWILLFLHKRKELDHQRFKQMGNEQTKIIELVNGMQEIKLFNSERQKRWGWEKLQASLFHLNVRNLKLQQIQTSGSNAINELKNILITMFSAELVITGEITLGMMMAISYITGQLNLPIQQLLGFLYALQDADIALERLSEIHEMEAEEAPDTHVIQTLNSDIELQQVTFSYPESVHPVLNGVSLTIPFKKTTAIVGTSGSGKSTLLKLLLKFYDPNQGVILANQNDLRTISHESWRNVCGAVMQEGFIFNDTIAGNIAVGQEEIDPVRMERALEIANIHTYVNSLPKKLETKLGADGIGFSTGQKQRILIARAVYKNPEILFFDEATSALDAQNERIIMNNLNRFFQERTAIVIAHRLSTVKNADQIVVLDNGKICETGTHQELIQLKGIYYNLIKNQLELDK